MSKNTKIEWTDATWNPVKGCSRISEGCRNCYAERIAARFSNGPERLVEVDGEAYITWAGPWAGYAETTPSGPRWTGRVELDEGKLELPLHWRRPRRIFACSMADLFHENLSAPDISRIWRVMTEAKRHWFLVLTKRAHIARVVMPYLHRIYGPQPHISVGFSAENQVAFDDRWRHVRDWPIGGTTFASLEPLLGPITLPGEFLCGSRRWVIVGGESGPGARPMHPDWARAIRDQCIGAGVPFFFKQWGEWLPQDQFGADGDKPTVVVTGGARVRGVWRSGGTNGLRGEDGYVEAYRVGKRNAGALLDGRHWREFP